MARSRSRSRDRSRRKHSSSDESDYDRRKRSSKKKKRRSRSRSTDSDRRRYKKSEGSRHHRSGYDDDRRASSRSERKDSMQRSRQRDRSRDRSPSDKSRREKEGRRSEKEESRESSNKITSQRSKDARENSSRDVGDDKGLSLKERIAKLVSSSSDKSNLTTDYKIDNEKVAEIDTQGFHQQTFVSSATKKNLNGSKVFNSTAENEKDSHESAIFGVSSQTVKASSSLVKSNGSNLSDQHDYDDEIFGPSLLIDQRLRTDRWLEKLQLIRQRILQESV